jgi:hypothetical protein
MKLKRLMLPRPRKKRKKHSSLFLSREKCKCLQIKELHKSSPGTNALTYFSNEKDTLKKGKY